MTKCGINAQLLSEESGYRKAGIHVYLWETLRHLPANPDLTYEVFSTFRPTVETEALINWQKTADGTTNPLGRIVWEQLVWPVRNWLNRYDLIHGTAFSLPLVSRKPSVVTIFDLSFAYYPELFPRFRRVYLNTMTRLACRKATRIITISEASKQDIVRLYGVSPDKIGVVYPGVREQFMQPSAKTVEQYRAKMRLPESFVLHVGTLQPRKNLPMLIEAFREANLTNTDLVLAGGKGWFYDEIYSKVKAMNLEDRVHFTGYVPDEDLPKLYAAADLLAFPSLYEGFGMPIVEAMSCGTPIISSNVSAMPEAVGDAGILFDPTSVAELKSHLQALFADRSLLAELSKKGIAQAARFSWAKAGEEMAQVYLDVAVG